MTGRRGIKRLHRGFTLMEVMVVVGITGILLTSALAPMVYSVHLLRDVQENYAHANRERFVMERIFNDVRDTVQPGAGKAFRVKDGQSLLLWTLTPANEGLPAGCVVFSVVSDGGIKDAVGGLYRWFFPRVTALEDVEVQNLNPAEGVLLLAGVKKMKASVWDRKEWLKEYEGDPPLALDLALEIDEKEVSRVDWFVR